MGERAVGRERGRERQGERGRQRKRRKKLVFNAQSTMTSAKRDKEAGF